MAQLAEPVIPEENSWRPAALALAGLAGIGIGLNLIDPSRVPALQNFLLVFSSLLIEAMPFVLLGALVAAFIEVFVPGSVFERLSRVRPSLQLPVAGMAGFAFPVCECGSVPVA